MRFLQKHEDEIQLITGVLAAILTAWHQIELGRTFWHWFPLAFFAFFAVQFLWVVVWFVRRKLTYQQFAAANKANLQSGGDGWPRQNDS